MADTTPIRAGRAYVELFLKNQLAPQLRAAELQFKAWGASVVAVGSRVAGTSLAVGAALALTVAQYATTGNELYRMSQRTGASVEALSELQAVAVRQGGTVEDLEHGFKGLSQFLGQVAGGSEEATRYLAELGVTMDQLNRMTPVERFEALADAIGRVQDASRRDFLSTRVFGEAGRNLLPVIQAGAQRAAAAPATPASPPAGGIAGQRAEVRRLGLTVSTADARAAAALTVAWNTLRATFDLVVIRIGGALAPAVTDLATRAQGLVARVAAWVGENKGLVMTVAQATAVALGAGAALIGLGVALKLAGAAAGVLATLVGGAAAVVRVATAAVTALAGVSRIAAVAVRAVGVAARLAGAALVFLSTPLGLVTAVGVALTSMGGGATVAGLAVLTAVAAIKLLPVACAAGTAGLGVLKAAAAGLAVVWAFMTGTLFTLPGLLAAAGVGLLAFAGYMAYTRGLGRDTAGALGETFATIKAAAADVWDGFAERAGEAFDGLVDTATTTIAGVVDAIKGGDLGAALAVAVAGLKVAWVQGLTFLRGEWIRFRHSLTAGQDTAADQTASVLVSVWNGLKVFIFNLGELMAKGIVAVIHTLKAAWIEFMGFLERSWERIKAGPFGDASEAITQVDARVAAELAANDRDRDRLRQRVERNANAARAGTVGNERDMQAQLREAARAEQRRRDAARDLELAENARRGEEELRPLREELAQAVAAAAQAAARAREPRPEAGPPAPDFGRLAQGVQAVGTFSAAAIPGLLGGQPQLDRLIEIGRRSVEVQDEIRRNTAAPGITVGRG